MLEHDAFEYEKELIKNYWEIEQCVTNLIEGGKGGPSLPGEKNPMYGRPWWDENTPSEKIKAWKKRLSLPGEKNPAYGKPFHERMSADVYKGWIEKHKQMLGEQNPNYGNTKLKEFYRDNPEERKKLGRKGSQNGRCVPVKMYDGNMNFIRKFCYIGECAQYLIENKISKATKVSSIRDYISSSIKKGNKYLGYYFKCI